MATGADSGKLAGPIRSVLRGLKWRIRVYVFLEGAALAVIWLGLTFWLGLAVDYFPILVGASELPHLARAILRAVIAIGLAVLIYRWILRRTLTRLTDRSMAVLLERRFASFKDSLVTAVELNSAPAHAAHFAEDMLVQTSGEALLETKQVRFASVFNFAPLLTKMSGAVFVATPILAFSLIYENAFDTWINRLYLLSDQPWPRSAHIEVVGIDMLRSEEFLWGNEPPSFTTFVNHSVKAAKGGSLNLIVQADAGARVVPETCTIVYETAEQDRGRVSMRKIGRPRDGFQRYSFDGKPFKGVLSSIDFDVIGFDHRLRDYRINVVDSPTIVDIEIDCKFPAYMERLDLIGQPWHKGITLPLSSQVTIRCKTNKPIRQAMIRDTSLPTNATEEPLPENNTASPHDAIETIVLAEAASAKVFEYRVESLQNDIDIQVSLSDVDGILSDRPQHIDILSLADESPRVELGLNGIGTAITPDAIVPINTAVSDDHGIDGVWIDLFINDATPREFPCVPNRDGQAQYEIDFRLERGPKNATPIVPGNQVVIASHATDRFELNGTGPNIGRSGRVELEVVTPEELLRILERAELGLRQRFELIIEEMTDTRDSLARVHGDFIGTEDSGDDPEDQLGASPSATEDSSNSAGEKEQRARSLRILRTQRSQMQSEKSAQELLGVALSFNDIRQELIHNRVVDSEDRQKRLKEQIADPLREIGTSMFPELDQLLHDLEAALEHPESAQTSSQNALAQTNDILVEMDAVLQQMLQLETYNELLEIVRELLETQDGLLDDTKKERKKQLLGDLILPE